MERRTIRTLKAHEIDVRVQQVCGDDNSPGAILLLYKDARCDMAILDETFGMYGWQREHTFKDDKNYCKVSIWDDTKGMWIASNRLPSPLPTQRACRVYTSTTISR